MATVFYLFIVINGKQELLKFETRRDIIRFLADQVYKTTIMHVTHNFKDLRDKVQEFEGGKFVFFDDRLCISFIDILSMFKVSDPQTIEATFQHKTKGPIVEKAKYPYQFERMDLTYEGFLGVFKT